jgi:hypothetical protein
MHSKLSQLSPTEETRFAPPSPTPKTQRPLTCAQRFSALTCIALENPVSSRALCKRIPFITFAICVGHYTRSSTSPQQRHAPPRSLPNIAPPETESKENAHQRPARKQKSLPPYIPPQAPQKTRSPFTNTRIAWRNPSIIAELLNLHSCLSSLQTNLHYPHNIRSSPSALQSNLLLLRRHPPLHPRTRRNHKVCSITPSRTTASIASSASASVRACRYHVKTLRARRLVLAAARNRGEQALRSSKGCALRGSRWGSPNSARLTLPRGSRTVTLSLTQYELRWAGWPTKGVIREAGKFGYCVVFWIFGRSYV